MCIYHHKILHGCNVCGFESDTYGWWCLQPKIAFVMFSVCIFFPFFQVPFRFQVPMSNFSRDFFLIAKVASYTWNACQTPNPTPRANQSAVWTSGCRLPALCALQFAQCVFSCNSFVIFVTQEEGTASKHLAPADMQWQFWDSVFRTCRWRGGNRGEADAGAPGERSKPPW